MHIDVVTLFPGMFRGPFDESIVKRAVDRGAVSIGLHNPRDHGLGRHKVVDDYPYGGGAGMVMKPEPLVATVESVRRPDSVVVLLTPQGELFQQRLAQELAKAPHLVLICGHYEGVDERVTQIVDAREVSIGDYVLTGGELAAMVVVDAVVRLLPGVLDPESVHEESHALGLLEYPHYTRPPEFRGLRVPDVLLSGDHGAIAAWRRRQALLRTFQRRPELLRDEDWEALERLGLLDERP
ncbi:MAG TPA: tRNA (guanosine(37)-N1)-methyltransferase TrmD [Chloroflexota bacterium]